MPSLFEKYRPASFEEVLGQDKAIRALKRLRDAGGFGGRAYWLSGLSGTGKDSIARIMAADLAEDWNTETIDAGAITCAGLREIEDSLRYTGMGAKTGRAIIISEAHGLRKDVIRSLLVMLERLPKHAMIVFTTTRAGQESLFEDYDDAGPLMSRCLVFKLAQRDLTNAFASRAKQIAEAEGLDGRDVKHYVRLVQTHRQNFRAVLSAIEAGEMSGNAEDDQ